jgi:hypothetical protein
MKLLRYGLPGQERPGLLDSDGCIRDLSRDVADIGPDCLLSARLAGLVKLDPRSAAPRGWDARLRVPVARVGRLIAVMTLGIEGPGEQRQEVITWQRTGGGPSNGL